MAIPLPRDDYRYTVEVDGENITPLASARCFIGEEDLRILNISRGGVALLCNQTPKFQEGDRVGVAIEIRGRSFPVEIEIRGIKGLRANCQFVSPSRMFQGSLKEFLQPKFLGETLTRRDEFSDRADMMSLVPDAGRYEAYIGQNQTGFFVWLKSERVLARLVGVSQDLVFEWTDGGGFKTGRNGPRRTPDPSQPAPSNGEASLVGDGNEIQWARIADDPILHYFADILLAWLNPANGREFVEALFADEENSEIRDQKFRFPKP